MICRLIWTDEVGLDEFLYTSRAVWRQDGYGIDCLVENDENSAIWQVVAFLGGRHWTDNDGLEITASNRAGSVDAAKADAEQWANRLLMLLKKDCGGE